MPFSVGANVGPYRIIEKLGQGGMATVYKAYHAALDRYVALKVLHPAFLEDPNFQARFQREARLVAKLDHPNIVPIYDFAAHDNQPYLVMKYIEGETLKARLGRGRLSAEEIWDVVNSVGAGLAYAHKQGILHRDVKPSNVILSQQDGQVYLADFGLARIAQSGESTLSSDMIMGTPQYISPEQAMGVKDLDEGTDIYSFAVMLYEMVVGQVPFSSDTPFSIIHDHIYSPLPLPHLTNPNVPDEVERVLLKALAKERTARYEDVSSLVASFKQAWETSGADMDDVTMTAPLRTAERTGKHEVSAEALTVPPVSAQAPTVIQQEPAASTAPVETQSGKKKRSPWPFIAGGVLLLLCCMFAFAALRRGGLEPAPEEFPTPTALASKTPGPENRPPNRPTDFPVPPEVEAARKLVNENPDDPYAHLELALALLNASQPNFAYEQLSRAAELAGDRMDFFIEAGNRLSDREAWVGASAMYLRAIRFVPPAEETPDGLVDAFHEATYKASSQPDMPEYIPFEAIGRIDEPIMLIAEARHTFYNGNPDDAHATLNDLKRMKPGFPEARLLEAELAAREGNFDDARALLEVLLADLNTPDWIRVESEDALRQLP